MAINTATKIHQGKNRVKLLRDMESPTVFVPPATDCNELRKTLATNYTNSTKLFRVIREIRGKPFLESILQQGGGSDHGLHGSSSTVTRSASAPIERCASGRYHHRQP